jgi:hypothetical protein
MNPQEQEQVILLLKAQNAAIIAMLQRIPAGDGQPILGIHRWPEFEEEFRQRKLELGLKP